MDGIDSSEGSVTGLISYDGGRWIGGRVDCDGAYQCGSGSSVYLLGVECLVHRLGWGPEDRGVRGVDGCH